MKIQSLVFAILTALPLFGCAAPRDWDTRYVVLVDKHGSPLVPRGKHGFGAQLNDIREALRVFYENSPDNRRILIFVHGGLNPHGRTIDRNTRFTEQILSEGTFPIYLGWNSSLLSTYGDHLFRVRRGNEFPWWSVPLAPFLLVSDVVRGVVDIPISLAYHGYRVICEGTSLGGVGLPGARSSPMYGSPDIAVGRFDPEDGFEPGPIAAGLATLPARVAATPIIAGMGPRAWQMMHRRIRLMVEPESISHSGGGPESPRGVPMLFHALADFIQEEQAEGRKDWEIDLVGHSMGCMVINEFIHQSLFTGQADLPPIDHLVYLAPACSVRELEGSVFPFLEADQGCRLHILTLPFKGDVLECFANGSLLLWIDDNLSTPVSEIDHTLGRLPNVLLGLHRFPESIRSRVQIKPSDPDAEWSPVRHQDFSAPGFWRRSNWTVDRRQSAGTRVIPRR